MLDFTSSLYLGLRHSHAGLRPWGGYTTGVPAAVAAPPLALVVARELAELTGTGRTSLSRSTLHAFWDLFGWLAPRGTAIFLDAGVYPIAHWGVERARFRGARVSVFAHHDPAHLRRLLSRKTPATAGPLVVTDGLCPGCGRVAPLPDYLRAVRRHGGLLVVDDTQALGVLGTVPRLGSPYGAGGGGSLRMHAIRASDILLVSSLAKGLGVPIAVVCGSEQVVGAFERCSETRVHCSPPSVADLSAAEHALGENRSRGDALRSRLLGVVERFRRGLARAGFPLCPSEFPVQSLCSRSDTEAAALHQRLLRLGVRTVLSRRSCRHDAVVSFLITAAHTPSEIDRAVEAIDRATRAGAAPQLPRPGERTLSEMVGTR